MGFNSGFKGLKSSVFFPPDRPNVPYFIEQIFVVYFTNRNCLYVPTASIDDRRGGNLWIERNFERSSHYNSRHCSCVCLERLKKITASLNPNDWYPDWSKTTNIPYKDLNGHSCDFLFGNGWKLQTQFSYTF